MNILVIGGTGFIGDYLVQNLSLRQDLYTTVLYRSTKPGKEVKSVNYLNIDAASQSKALGEIFKKTDCLVLLSRPDKKIIQNIVHSKVRFKKIIYVSTILIYPNSRKPQSENAKLIAANSYEQGKIDEEKVLSEYSEISEIKLCIARLTNIYGDIKNRGLVHYILDALINKKSFHLNNNGKQTRDFLFVEDAAKYLELLIFAPQTKFVEIFNICSGEGHSAKELILKVEKISGKKLKISKGAQTGEKLCVIGDNSKIVKTTGYKPVFSFEEGLRKAISNYQR